GEEGGLRLTCSPQRETALYMGGMQYDPWPLLSRISSPVLILEGEKSENRGFINLDRVRSLIPDCAYHLVGGAGHLIPMEQPREVTRLIREFFGSLRSREKLAKRRNENGSAGRKNPGSERRPDAKRGPLQNVYGWDTTLVKRTISHAGGHGQAGAR
ncbi:MAG: hypothetical protein Q8O11_01160, partial [Syntrophales bacterium]|nr:hypothetical protein [Syntrophales bacterium]